MRLLVVVAHPDDEAFGCGSLLAHASARGVETFVLCATRGELGEPAPGSGIAQNDLADVREAELRSACALLGVSRVELLDHLDSGMTGPAAPGSLATADLVTHRPQRTYLYCLSRSLMAAFTGNQNLETPDEDITTLIDVADLLSLRWKAIRAHRSQVPPFGAMDPALQRGFLATDRLRRVDPVWTGAQAALDWVPQPVRT